MKYLALAFLLLFAITTEINLKSKSKTKCKMSGEKCTFNAQCCGNRACLSKKGHVCGSHLNVGEPCGENGECGKPNFCYDKVCTAPFETGHKCKHGYQCQSNDCDGNWIGIKTGKCK